MKIIIPITKVSIYKAERMMIRSDLKEFLVVVYHGADYIDDFNAFLSPCG